MDSVNIINAGLRFRNTMDIRKVTERIIIHHAAAESCTVSQIHSWHLANGWAGIGYHFFVRKNGAVYYGRPENTVGCHAAGGNYNSIGVCFEGDYMLESKMPTVQKESGKRLVAHLKRKYGIKRVQKHKEVSSTDCPGVYFPFGEISDGSESITIPGQKDVSIEVDGSWGPATVIRTQELLETIQDAIVSNQPMSNKRYLPNAHASAWEFKTSGYVDGSSMVRKLQEKIGAVEDGWFGKNSVIALQGYLGVNQDGSMGPETVKAWQRHLNKTV